MFRSLLFIPGNNPSMLQNADIFTSDAIIFDLEDAVSINEKDNARNLVETYLLTNKILPKHIVLRVNPVNTEFIDDDLDLLRNQKIDYLLLPKANTLSLFIMDKKLSHLEKKYGIQPTKIICLIEETKAVLEANELAGHHRVKGLLLGAEDLTSELGINRTLKGEEIQFARSQIIYAAMNHRIISIDTPYTDISNEEGLCYDAKHAAALGMKAKTAIHPNQLEIINQVFSPSQEMINWAKGVVKKSNETGRGVFQFQGKMIDKPVIDKANKIIETANKYGLL
ncbi:MAG TPA: CoA ester lyase [Candidatus Izemoplasmatales bacterium]|nr:CoA ester lyase [Candidatus Izemoplasmatales bacterium]